MISTGSPTMDAERAFARAVGRRRRAALARALRLAPAGSGSLPVFDARELARGHRREVPIGTHAIPLEAISGTLEPSRASMFDRDFRPARAARGRWERVWLAEQRGCPLPPISVLPAGDGYVLRDGHHRVSVARARGATTIDATLDAAA
jgi:hypothetical protein